ncbi:DUF2177 family protein [Roseivirga misakiensis]|uniref:DUF2177 domain-containing protein n=1 Tax=Roseivirga misakiensis TaxID=1563681 RepID=A0A1E5T1Z4_9BACT|nr:DUF2177 family protein [Roseivirga misakiensis]OEK05390.1 hypothetical protein BFP71_18540 [Roseivirga misakiensis]
MSFALLVKSYLLTTVVFFAIDILWLGIIAKNLYNKHLRKLLAPKVNWAAAIVFYLLFIVGIFYFAIVPSVEEASLEAAMLNGGLFGFFTYATYDLTNLATLRGWPIKIVFIDIIWGAVLTASVSTAGFYITNWLMA